MRNMKRHKAHFVSRFRNQRGDALIMALMFVGLTAMIAAAIPSLMEMKQRQARLIRVRTLMSTLETRIKSLVLQSTSYTGCDSSVGYSSCQLIPNLFDPYLVTVVSGARCAVSPCGIQLSFTGVGGSTSLDVDVATGNPVFLAKLTYMGTDISLQPTEIKVQIPTDILQSQAFDCAAIDATRPLFAGFDSLGKLVCKPLPSDCPVGTYVKGIDPQTLALVCEPLSGSGSVSCSATDLMSDLSWSGGTTFTRSCQTRLDPFVVFPMATCSWGASTLNHGQSVTAYQQGSVPFGSSCLSETRVCSNGTLSGSYGFSSCSAAPPANCVFNGVTVIHGASVTAWFEPMSPSCAQENRVCFNGTLSGSYTNSSCTTSLASCSFGSQTIADGSSVTAYYWPYEYKMYGSSYTPTCSSEVRTCSNGTLSSSTFLPATYETCDVGCNIGGFFGVDLIPGQSITMYRYEFVGPTESCTSPGRSQVRTCQSGGNFSGSGQFSHVSCARRECSSLIASGSHCGVAGSMWQPDMGYCGAWGPGAVTYPSSHMMGPNQIPSYCRRNCASGAYTTYSSFPTRYRCL